MSTTTLNIKTFGALRTFAPNGVVAIDVALPVTVAHLKQHLREQWGADAEEFLNQSVLATETEILAHDAMVESSLDLSILPPVCGG